MKKCCGFCKYSYCADLSDVSGLDCEKFKTLKIKDLNQIHPFCIDGFRWSIIRILYRWSLNE